MKELRREKYLSKIRPFYNDTDIIKVLTGVRRCGKSTIMKQIMDDLGTDTKVEKSIVYIEKKFTVQIVQWTPHLLYYQHIRRFFF